MITMYEMIMTNDLEVNACLTPRGVTASVMEVIHLLGLEVTPQSSTLTLGELQHDRYRPSNLSRLVGGSHLSGIPEP
jgi:hypothetical protein